MRPVRANRWFSFCISRWKRFNLRALFALTAAIGIMLAGAIYRHGIVSAHAARVQNAKSKGALVGFGNINDPWLATYVQGSWASEMLWISDVVSVSYRGCKDVTDGEVVELADFADLTLLDLTGTAISDEALDSIAELPHVREIVLDGTHVTDAGLAKLQKSHSLQRIYLRETVDFEGYAHRPAVSERALLALQRTSPHVEIVR